MADNNNQTPEEAGTENTSSDFAAVKMQDSSRPEISGVAIARMMGVATGSEIKLLEGKLDLISGRLNNLTVRVDKILSSFASLPTGSDLERIDVQIGSLKALVRDLTIMVSGESVSPSKKPAAKAATEIVTPAESPEPAETEDSAKA